MNRKISILGSTGSIGQNALKVVDNLKRRFGNSIPYSTFESRSFN